MLNNKTHSVTAHSKIKAITDPDLFSQLKTLAFAPLTPTNTPNSSCVAMGSTAKFYISSSSSSSSKAIVMTLFTSQSIADVRLVVRENNKIIFRCAREMHAKQSTLLSY